jgi:hypothetical protein
VAIGVAASNYEDKQMHYFTKERAERLAKQDKHWRVRKSKQYDHLYMVWSDESDHYVEFNDLEGLETW